ITIINRSTDTTGDPSDTDTSPTTEPTEPSEPAEPAGPAGPVEPEQPSESAANAPNDVFRSNVVQGDMKTVENIAARIMAVNDKPNPAYFTDMPGQLADKKIGLFAKLHVIESYRYGTSMLNVDITRAEF